jgi:drug/metabolite transporter (DMT)-like permease
MRLHDPELQRTAKGIAWALLAVTIWAGWFVATRIAVGPGGVLGASDLVAIRAGIGGLVLLPVFVARVSSLPRSAFVDGRWLTVGSGAPFALIVSAGLRYAPASHAAALTPGTMPLWAALLGLVFLRDRLGRVQLLGLALIASGALVLAGGLAGQQAVLGHGFFLIGATLFAAGTVRMRGSQLKPLDATALVGAYSLVGYLPFYLLAGTSNLALASARELVFQGIYQGVLVSAVALLAFNRAIALLGRRAPAFAALVPVLATLFAIPAIGEIPGSAESVAVIAIALGVLLIQTGGISFRRT